MSDAPLSYQRAKFRAEFPVDRLYTEGHFWMAPEPDGIQRVGFTKFAARMLGEIVEFDFEVGPGAPVELGQTIGWLEGFKAVSDIYSPLAGSFAGANPALDADASAIHKSPFGRGWLFRVTGAAPDDAMTATEYAAFLDGTIDRMMGKSS